MTRIIGILSWFDESPTWLAQTIASMARMCDYVVAVDGRYALYDDPRVVSSIAEHDAIVQTARGAGLGITLHVPTQAWRDEMHKRTASFQLAQLVAEPHRDWFTVLDGDEVFVEAAPRDLIVAKLDGFAAAGVRTATVTLRDVADPHENAQRTSFGMGLAVPHVVQCRVPRLFRFPENLRVVGYHYNYVGEDEHGEPVELWGQDNAARYRTEWGCMIDDVVIEHKHQQRPKVRKAQRERYYQDRDAVQLETLDTLDRLEQKDMVTG